MKFSLRVEEFISDFNAVYKIEDISKTIKECKSSNMYVSNSPTFEIRIQPTRARRTFITFFLFGYRDFADVDQITESVTEMCKPPTSDNTCINGSCDSNEVTEQIDQIERSLRQLNIHTENLCVDMDTSAKRETEYVEGTLFCLLFVVPYTHTLLTVQNFTPLIPIRHRLLVRLQRLE